MSKPIVRYEISGYNYDTYESDEGEYVHFTDYQRLLDVNKKLREGLENLGEFTASILEDMEHYYDNKCCPTVDEVNQCASADSKVRYLIAKHKIEGGS